MELGIEGKVALVTGASEGLGLGVATALVREGANVAISSRSRGRVDAAASAIGASGFVHDAADVDAAPELVRSVAARLGPIEILVANSGGPPASADALSFTLEQWRAGSGTSRSSPRLRRFCAQSPPVTSPALRYSSTAAPGGAGRRW